MKKLNVQVYEGFPEELQSNDNNNLFIQGEIEYNSGGTKVKSISSIKNSKGEEIASGSDEYINLADAIGENQLEMWGEYSSEDFPATTGEMFEDSIYSILPDEGSALFSESLSIQDIPHIAKISKAETSDYINVEAIYDLYIKEVSGEGGEDEGDDEGDDDEPAA